MNKALDGTSSEGNDGKNVSEVSGEDTAKDNEENFRSKKIDCLRLVEALLFASAEPLTERQIAARIPSDFDVKSTLRALEVQYLERGVELFNMGGAWAFRTAPDLADFFSRDIQITRKLSNAAVETLSIIAYHQPVTRTEIEEIRGVSVSKGTIDVLLAHGWIKPRGRKKTPGRPLMWATNDNFLDHFGLKKITDLPGLSELKSMGLLDAPPLFEKEGTEAKEKENLLLPITDSSLDKNSRE